MHALQFFAPHLAPPQVSLQTIEVRSRLQLPGIQIIGLPGPEVAEAKERIASALESLGLATLNRRMVLNLTPAAIRKRGTSSDLAMALAVLAELNPQSLAPEFSRDPQRILATGELGLQGQLKSSGGLAAALILAIQNKIHWICVPNADYPAALRAWKQLRKQAFLQKNNAIPRLIGFASLHQAWDWLRHGDAPTIECAHSETEVLPSLPPPPPLVLLPPILERWAGIVASGRHHTLVFGPHGSGKSQFLEWIAHLQGPQSASTAQWRWCHGMDWDLGQLLPVIRRVQPEISAPGLLGSSAMGLEHLIWGEVTWATGGVLIANEFLEWKRSARECLREPLEKGQVTLAALQGRVTLPAQFQLLASANWCECGESEHPLSLCRCAPHRKQKYWSKISGPLLDRIDFSVGISPGVFRAHPQAVSVPLWSSLKTRVANTQKKLITQLGQLPGEAGAMIYDDQMHQALDALTCSWHTPVSLRARQQILRLAQSIHAWDHPDSEQTWSQVSLQEAWTLRQSQLQWQQNTSAD